MPNRLASETSPYLQQHKDNPVDWYPWGEEAFAEAKAKDRPILLSVGYSACHWCHVMEHESFEDPQIAALMNESFVSIKVDREERPDVDAIYMAAVQSMSGHGGWPMTVFLTPDGRPFFAGTYYPPEDRQGLPGFPRILTALADVYRNRRGDIERTADQVVEAISAASNLRSAGQPLTDAVLHGAFQAIAANHDVAHGGFGKAPKFPQAMTLDFLLRYYHRGARPGALAMVERTLTKMALGGMYDQVGGGFHRYSTDAVWLVPHFEKMLYDNALLARVYLDAFKVTGNAFYRRIATETLDYVLREMTDASGGFYSTQDADSEGVEGKFFVWGVEEIEDALGAEAPLLLRYFGATPAGNFEGRNILHVPVDPEEFARLEGLDPDELARRVDQARARLYAVRERRVHPGRDEKVLSAWNGMMVRAFATAAAALDEPRYRDAAVRNADFLLSAMRPNGRLLRTWKDGTAKLKGYLEDYANLVDGLLAIYEATFEARFLRSAIGLADEMVRLFWDDGVQGFFDTGSDHEALIARPRELFDNATPSGTAVAIDVLLRLAALTGDVERERRASACLRALATLIERAPTGFGRLLAALDFHLSRPVELAVVWPERRQEAKALLEAAFAAYRPNLVIAGGRDGDDEGVTPLLLDRPALDGKATAYVCERYVCQAPTTDASELRRQLDAAGGSG